MNYIKKVLVGFAYTIVSLIIFTFFITLLNYFNVFNYKVLNVFKILVLLLAVFIGSLMVGKKSIKKGWLEGLKYSVIFLFVFTIINVILSNKIKLIDLIYYIGIVIISMLGSILGINKKGESK